MFFRLNILLPKPSRFEWHPFSSSVTDDYVSLNERCLLEIFQAKKIKMDLDEIAKADKDDNAKDEESDDSEKEEDVPNNEADELEEELDDSDEETDDIDADDDDEQFDDDKEPEGLDEFFNLICNYVGGTTTKDIKIRIHHKGDTILDFFGHNLPFRYDLLGDLYDEHGELQIGIYNF